MSAVRIRWMTVVLLVVIAGCARDDSAEALSAAGVVGCAHTAAWGTITRVTPEGGRLLIEVEPDRWLISEAGMNGPVVLFAEQPAVVVGDPVWTVGRHGLATISEMKSDAFYPDDLGQELERVWREAGARPLNDCPCSTN